MRGGRVSERYETKEEDDRIEKKNENEVRRSPIPWTPGQNLCDQV